LEGIPAILKVGDWHGGAASTEYEFSGRDNAPRDCPVTLAVGDSSSAFHVTSVIT